jgi:hypothetical protein
MFNPVIIIALVAQSIISKASRMAGAVVGFLITSGILLWGLGVYAEGDEIAFFGVAIPQVVFVILCLIWYAFNVKEIFAAKNMEKALENPVLQNEPVKNFYHNTREAWSRGDLNFLDPVFQSSSRNKTDENFMKELPPLKGSSLEMFLEKYIPFEGEYLIATGDVQGVSDPAWFFVTNMRLIQRDGETFEFRTIMLDEISYYKIEKDVQTKTNTLHIGLTSGEQVYFKKILLYMKEKWAEEMIKRHVPQTQIPFSPLPG